MAEGVEVGHFCELWALPGVSGAVRTSLGLGLPQLLGDVGRSRMLTSAACPVGRNGLEPHQTDVIPLGEQGGRMLVADPASSLSLVCSELVGVCVWIMAAWDHMCWPRTTLSSVPEPKLTWAQAVAAQNQGTSRTALLTWKTSSPAA